MSTAFQTVVVLNTRGLHARPAMQFVDLATTFKSHIVVKKPGGDPPEVDGKSIMEMITLEAVQGTQLEIWAEGADAETAVKCLALLFHNRFNDEED